MSSETEEVWDDLYKPPTQPPRTTVPPEKRYITGIDSHSFRKDVHLILSRQTKDLHDAVHRLRRVMRYEGFTCELLGDDVPCLFYLGAAHWSVIQSDMSDIQKSGKQAFIATMNTFAIDQFYFKSREDARNRILHAGTGGALRRMSPGDADDFFVAYRVGAQHTSEVLRTKGLW